MLICSVVVLTLKQKIVGSHGDFKHKLQDPIINSEERWRWGEVWGLPSESNRALDENFKMNRSEELEPLFFVGLIRLVVLKFSVIFVP